MVYVDGCPGDFANSELSPIRQLQEVRSLAVSQYGSGTALRLYILGGFLGERALGEGNDTV
jgi:hypothetical protein